MMACEACCTEYMTMISSSGNNQQQQQMMSMMGRCMMLYRGCADMWRMASLMMCRGSEYIKQMCEMCDAYATECEKMGNNMDMCKQCADACRRCAQECRNMMR